ncbi:MAG: hypothetical protein MRERC_1c018 [Mycoplasmataceae bacterium RC_NB112A]|nr:MAG: hypothetical protein MRERC_10c003 [Mycoplasmataceae bacterium RC_NB112A]KLL02439.1 MAG: hypothetical protein MRERC_1c018 [Mycoplasmataceae bacterium RC_NB112A]
MILTNLKKNYLLTSKKVLRRKLKGIKQAEKVRWRIKVVSNARNEKDFDLFSGFRLENILGIKNYHSVRIGVQRCCFFFWEDNQAWEIKISKHNYKNQKRRKFLIDWQLVSKTYNIKIRHKKYLFSKIWRKKKNFHLKIFLKV